MAEKIFNIPFAELGDRADVPDAVQPSGEVSYSQGYGPDYERANTDPSYKPIGRQEWNGIMHDITGAIGEIQKLGMARWSGDASPYAMDSLVYHMGNAWISAVTNNNGEPGVGDSWISLATPPLINGLIPFVIPGTHPWVVPPRITHALGIVIGGGGGGSASVGVDRNGGGGGGWAIKLIDLRDESSLQMTVGAGGAGGKSGEHGTNGGTSSFDTIFSATGGRASSGGNGRGGAGGYGVAGDINGSLGDGGSVSLETTIGGSGGGPGGAGSVPVASYGGRPGQGFGGGGGGASGEGLDAGDGGSGAIFILF